MTVHGSNCTGISVSATELINLQLITEATILDGNPITDFDGCGQY